MLKSAINESVFVDRIVESVNEDYHLGECSLHKLPFTNSPITESSANKTMKNFDVIYYAIVEDSVKWGCLTSFIITVSSANKTLSDSEFCSYPYISVVENSVKEDSGS